MTTTPALLIAVAVLGPWHGATALADQPPTAGIPSEPAAPGEPPAAQPPPLSTIPTAPAPPPAAPPPLVAQPPPIAAQPPERAPAADDPEAPAISSSPRRDARFGDAGQIVLDGALSASFGHLGYSTGDTSNTSLSVEPAFDYFATPNFSQGLSALIRYSDSTSGIGIETRNVTFGVTGQIGENIWLGDRVSFWPKLALGLWQSRSTYTAPPGGGFTVSIDGLPVSIGPSATEVTENAVFLGLFTPFLVHLTQHFFVGFGPNAYTDLNHTVESASNKRLFFGASSTVGGWF